VSTTREKLDSKKDVDLLRSPRFWAATALGFLISNRLFAGRRLLGKTKIQTAKHSVPRVKNETGALK